MWGSAGASAVVILTQIAAALTTCIEVEPSFLFLHPSFPGEFFGNSTRPDTCDEDGSGLLSCDSSPITDGLYGGTSGSVNASEFIAWNGSNSWITFTRTGSTTTLVGVRRVNLFFYHDPELGLGLPEFTLSGSISERTQGAPLKYTILGNQDLAAGDAQVRNVTIALTESITGEANRFHIEFSLTSGIQQFALSEVELCRDEVMVEAETLSVVLTSEPVEPVNGSTITLPANRTGVDEGSVITLSCTVANQGRFVWEWAMPGSVSFTPLVVDGTRTSVVEVPQNGDSVGEYTCTARYHSDAGLDPSPSTLNFTVDAERLLFTDKPSVGYDEFLESLSLTCFLAGIMFPTDEIEWSFNGITLNSGGRYRILTTNNEPCSYGICFLSKLRISSVNKYDMEYYFCSFNGASESITLFRDYVSPHPTRDPTSHPIPHPTKPVIPSMSPSQGPRPLSPLIVGLIVLATCALVLLVLAVVTTAVCVVVRRRKSFPGSANQPVYDYVRPPPPPAGRVQLKENKAYERLQTQPQGQNSATEAQETFQYEENEAYGMASTLNDPGPQDYETDTPVPNDAHGQTTAAMLPNPFTTQGQVTAESEIVPLQENVAYGQTGIVPSPEAPPVF